MNKNTIAILGALMLFGVGCRSVAPGAQPKPETSQALEYQYTCTSGPRAPALFGKAFDNDFKLAGWQTTDSSDVQVCVRTSDVIDEALIITLGPACDVKRAVGCDHVGIFDARMKPQKIEPLAFIETSEMYGISAFNKIIAWGADSLTYRASGLWADGGCTEEVVKETYVYQDRKVDLTSNNASRESVTKTCFQTSCSDKTLKCE